MKKTARYVISAALILCMVFALSACGFSTDSPAGVLTRSAMALKDKDSAWKEPGEIPIFDSLCRASNNSPAFKSKSIHLILVHD